MRRIAIIIPDCGEGGLFQFYNQFVPALAQLADVHLIFASPVHSPLVPAIPGATCHVVPPESAAPVLKQLLRGPLAIAPNLARALASAHNAWRTALALEPDCVEVCDWPLGAVPAALDRSMPIIAQCHGSMAQIAVHDRGPGGDVEGMLLGLIEPQVMGHAQALQTYSDANAHFWAATAGRPVSMIRPAFTLENISPPPPNDAGGIAIFGRLQAWKGPQVLCEALDQLGLGAPTCDWYGSAKPWPETGLIADKHLAAAFPAVWGRSLRFHGGVNRAVVARLMAESRAVIVPSTWDVFNFTGAEAMAAARPVLVSTGAGVSELIEHGVNGFIFANGDASALADAIERLLALAPEKAQAMGEAARETVRCELDPVRIAAKRFAGYEAAIRDHAAGLPRPMSGWLRDLLTPGTTRDFSMADFLGTLPVRPMFQSVAARVRRRLFSQSVAQ